MEFEWGAATHEVAPSAPADVVADESGVGFGLKLSDAAEAPPIVEFSGDPFDAELAAPAAAISIATWDAVEACADLGHDRALPGVDHQA